MKARNKAAALLALAALSFAALPAAAQTTTTFTVTAGGLAITAAPASVNLGTAPTTGTITGSLGNVTATDSRGSLVGGGWVASVTSTDFTTGGATADETIPKADVSYTSVLGTSSGVVTCVGTVTAQPLSGTVAAMTATIASLTNSCTWNPTISLSPAGKATGTYTGTITHSVA